MDILPNECLDDEKEPLYAYCMGSYLRGKPATGQSSLLAFCDLLETGVVAATADKLLSSRTLQLSQCRAIHARWVLLADMLLQMARALLFAAASCLEVTSGLAFCL